MTMTAKKRKTAACSVTAIPFDIERDILSRLPVKSLVRFKSVGKSWYRSLSEDPAFISKHLNRVSKTKGTNFLVSTCSPRLPYSRLDRDHDNTAWRWETLSSSKGIHGVVIGTINGLFCLSNLVYSKMHEHSKFDLKIHVWNPTTREIMEIRDCEVISKAISGAFYYHAISFGFCSKSNDYKVIKVLGSDRFLGPSEVQVYSVNKSSWKSSGIPNSDWVRWKPSCLLPKVFVSGASHWLVQQTKPPQRILIMSFKFEEEAFQDIMLPNQCKVDGDKRNPSDLFITEYRDFLSLVAREGNAFDVWVMKEYGVADSWVKQFSIDVSKIQVHWGSRTSSRFSLINFEDHENGDVLLYVDYNENNRRLFRYNTESKQIQDMGFYPMGQAISWKESIVSLPGMTAIRENSPNC